MNQKKEVINSWLLSIFLFQFGLLLPFALIIDIEIVYVFTTGIVLLVSLIINKFHFNSYFIIGAIILLIYIIASSIFHQIPIGILYSILIGFVAKGLSAMYIASTSINYMHLYRTFGFFSWANLFVLFFAVLLLDLHAHIGYMRLGYAIVPSSIILLGQLIFFKFRLYTFIGILISLALLLLYGNRGVFIVIALYTILSIIYTLRINIRAIILSIILMISLYIILSLNLATKFILYVYNEMDIYSYSLMKFVVAIEEGFIDSSSGRNLLYMEGLSEFLENPILGNGVGYSFTYSTTTAHNFILQILIESGVLGFALLAILTIFLAYNLIKIKDIYIMFVVITLFSLSIGRLSISSDLWLRTELWLLIGLIMGLFNLKNQRYKEKEKKTI